MDTPIVPRASSAPSPGTIVRCWDCREHFALDTLSLPDATGEYACPSCERRAVALMDVARFSVFFGRDLDVAR